jgi:hypothetical protein
MIGARVVSRRPLFYSRGADASLDRPEHVRAGSALARLPGGRLAVVQDDTAFLALVDLASGRVDDLPFPTPDGVRQEEKKRKLDLEAMIALADGTILAFGSGSTDRRARVVLIHGDDARIVEGPALYGALRAFAGLNIEGAALHDGDVVFFNRGNDGPDAVDATGRMDIDALYKHLRGAGPCPPLRDVAIWDLGKSRDGVRLTFTDAALDPSGRLAFLACAEATPDAISDGPVSGVSIGWLDDRARTLEIGEVLAEDGAPLTDKAEGLAFVDARRAFAVVDKDDPAKPCELLELAL